MKDNIRALFPNMHILENELKYIGHSKQLVNWLYLSIIQDYGKKR